MPVSKRGIKEERNQANHEREQQGALHWVKFAPTKSEDDPFLGGEDYDLKYAIGKAGSFPPRPLYFSGLREFTSMDQKSLRP